MKSFKEKRLLVRLVSLALMLVLPVAMYHFVENGQETVVQVLIAVSAAGAVSLILVP